MKKSKIILIAVYVIAALIVAYFAYGVAKKRYFAPEQSAGEAQSQPAVEPSAPENQDQSAEWESTEPTPSESVELPNVGKPDCDNDCASYKDNADNLKYCQEICGIIPAGEKNSEEDCAGLAGLDKDYCWRDLAVSKKDIDVCDKISDAKLQKVCRNRVVEEILD